MSATPLTPEGEREARSHWHGESYRRLFATLDAARAECKKWMRDALLHEERAARYEREAKAARKRLDTDGTFSMQAMVEDRAEYASARAVNEEAERGGNP